jgi:hypothetical protein
MLMTRGSRRPHALICLLVGAGLCFALWTSTLHHTDDGCPVELHCFACQWALAGKIDLVLPLPPVPALEVAFRTQAPEPPRLNASPAPRLESRGPPTT